MAKKTVYTCDACPAEFSPRTNKPDFQLRSYNPADDCYETLDLCPSCYAAFEPFIRSLLGSEDGEET